MSKRAVSVTLRPDNVLWLKTRVKATGGRSLSEALDEIITEARAGAGASAVAIRSVVGNAQIPRSDAALSQAAGELRALFRSAVGSPRGPTRKPTRNRPGRAATTRRRG